MIVKIYDWLMGIRVCISFFVLTNAVDSPGMALSAPAPGDYNWIIIE